MDHSLLPSAEIRPDLKGSLQDLGTDRTDLYWLPHDDSVQIRQHGASCHSIHAAAGRPLVVSQLPVRRWRLVYHSCHAAQGGTSMLQTTPILWGADGWPTLGALPKGIP